MENLLLAIMLVESMEKRRAATSTPADSPSHNISTSDRDDEKRNVAPTIRSCEQPCDVVGPDEHTQWVETIPGH